MPGSNAGWKERGGTSGSPIGRQGGPGKEGRSHHALEEEKVINHVNSRAEWLLATSLTGPGAAGGILET